MNWKSRLALAFLILLAAMPAAAQGVRYDKVLQNPQGHPISGATVTVCSAAATGQPCSPTVSIFTDAGLTTPKPNPFLTDANGNYGFWVAAGQYKLTITGSGVVSPITLDITPGCIPGATGCSSGGGSGTVTSVGFAVPSVLSVSGSPVVAAGTITVGFAGGQAQNQFLATPDGAAGALGLRAVVENDLPTSTVFTDQDAIFGANNYDFSGALLLKARVGAGLTTTTNGDFGFDSTNSNWHVWSGADLIVAPLAAGFVSGHCGQPTQTAGKWVIADTGAACGAGGGGFANPMTTLGDIIFENSTPAPTRLAGSTSATMAALTQTGNGTVSASPAWSLFVGGGANPVAATITSPSNGQTTCFDSSPKLVNCWDGAPAVVKTATYTAVQSDVGTIFAFNITTAATFTAAPTANSWFAGVWNEPGSTANVTIAVQSGTITGTTTLTPGQFATLVNDGTNWYSIVSSGGSSGLSGMTAGQVPVAATASTVTSSKAMQGTDTKILTSGTVSGTGAALCTDAAGGATTSGCPSGGPGSGGPNYAQSFTSQTQITMLGTSHNLGTKNLILACFDNASPANAIQPSSWAVDGTTFNVVVNFATAQTGYCTLNGSGPAVFESSESSSTSWSITAATHGLGVNLQVTAYDSNGNRIEPANLLVDSSGNVTLTWAVAQAGKVVITQ